MELTVPTILLLTYCNNFPSTLADEIDEVIANNHTDEDIRKMHYDINPEFSENLKLLVRTDRHILKSILENQAALYETVLVSMIFEAYNASTQAGHCATLEQRAHRKTIVERKAKIESVIDNSLDKMYEKWGELQTQDDLEEYFLKYWEDRNALYNYITNKTLERDCSDKEIMDQTCSAINVLESSFSDAMEAMGQCKSKQTEVPNRPIT